MGLFNKKKKEESSYHNGLPELPKLPELPHLPQKDSLSKSKPNALPRFPSSSLGDKFSQNTIKDAVTGEKEDNAVDDFENEVQKIPQSPAEKIPKKPIAPPKPQDYEDDEDEEEPLTKIPRFNKPMSMKESYSKQMGAGNEPIFIRLDKFEESMDLFDKIKKQILGVDKLLADIKTIKEREDTELESWQGKLETMKGQIEKIDKDIFSKLE